MESIREASIREMDVAIFVARGASYIFIQNIAQAIIGIAALAFIARLISKTEMGVFSTIMLITSAAQIAAAIGLSSAGTKFIAELQGKNDREASAAVAYAILTITFAISIVISILISIFPRELSIYLAKDIAYEGLFRLLPAISILAGPMLNLSGILLGLQKIKQLAIAGIVYSAVRWGMSIPLLVLGFGLYGILYGWIASEIAFVAFSLVLIVKSLGPPLFKFNLTRLLKFSWPLSISDWLSFASNWFDRILILALLPLSALGVYTVVFRGFQVLFAIPGAIATALFPQYSEIQGRNGIRSVEKASYLASRYLCFITIPLAIGLAATSLPTISLFAGSAYEEGALPLAILGFFLAIVSVGAPISYILLVMEKTVTYSGITIASVLGSTILGVLLLPVLGVAGASLARGATMLTGLMLTIYMLRREMNLNFDGEALWKSWAASIPMAVLVLSMQYVCYNKFLLPIYILAGATVYLLMLRILNAGKPRDFALMKLYVGKRFTFVLDRLEKLLLAYSTD